MTCRSHLRPAALSLAAAFSISSLLVNGAAPQIAVQLSGRSVQISWPAADGPYVLEQSATLKADSWQTAPQSSSTQAGQSSVTINAAERAQFYRLRLTSASAPFALTQVAPADGATEVGLTFHPQISFSRPVKVESVTTNTFYATAAGERLGAKVVPSKDGSYAWLFLDKPMPGGTRIRLTVDGDEILSAANPAPLDADGDGNPGGAGIFTFTTVSQLPVAGTSLAGIVVDPGPDKVPRSDDDVQAGPDGRLGTPDDVFLLPIQGARVFVVGQETTSVRTGPDGRFFFPDVPVGDVKIVVDGRPATVPPPGMYFPEMVLDARMELGRTNWTMVNGSEVYLPRVSQAILQNINSFTTNVVKATPEGADNLSAFQRSQLTVEVQPESLLGPDGRPLFGGQLGVSTVPPDLVRDMLPPGVLQHTFDITIQAPGVTKLATPAPMTFPNVFNAPPGTKLNLLSFDHTTGRLVIEGTATVSADGASVRTDPGVGITRPGWHGLTPPGSPNDPPCPPTTAPTTEIDPIPKGLIKVSESAELATAHEFEPFGSQNFLLVKDGGRVDLSFANFAAKIGGAESSPCSPANMAATPLEVRLELNSDAASKVFTDVPLLSVRLYPGQVHSWRLDLRPYNDLIAQDPAYDIDHLFGLRLTVRYFKVLTSGELEPMAGAPPPVYLYRYVDAADSDHTDGRLEFADTLADGIGRVLRRRPLKMDTSEDSIPALNILDERNFAIAPQELVFDPTEASKNYEEILAVQAPDGRAANVGALKLVGKGTPRVSVFLDEDGLKSRLAELTKAAPSPQGFTIKSRTPGGDGGYFHFSYQESTTAGVNLTPPLPYSSSAGEIQQALEALPGIGAGNVTVAREDVPQVSGEASHAARLTLTFGGSLAGKDLLPLSLKPTGTYITAGSGLAEQIVTVRSKNPADPAERFRLQYVTGAVQTDVWTAWLPANATVQQVTDALVALPAIDPGEVSVTRTSNDDQGGKLLHEYVYTVTFSGKAAGPTIRLMNVDTSNPLVEWHGSVLFESHLTPRVRALIETDAARQAIVDKVRANVLNRFRDFEGGVEIVNQRFPSSVTVSWQHGDQPLAYGTSGDIQGGFGVDDSLAMRDALAGFRPDSGSRSVYSFRLAQALNRIFPANLEVYPNNILKARYLIPFQPTVDQFANSLGHVVAHESAHTLGATHTAQSLGFDAIEQAQNETQQITLAGGTASSTFQLDFSGLVTEAIPRNASASALAGALVRLRIFQARDLAVEGPDGGPYKVQFRGDFTGVDVPQFLATGTAGLQVDVKTLDGGFLVLKTKGRVARLGSDGMSDIMWGGSLDYAATQSFRPGLSREVVKMGAKLDWSRDEADRALGFFIDYYAAGADNAIGENDRDRLPPISGAHLAIRKPGGELLFQRLEFAPTAVDGRGGVQTNLVLELLNFGDTPGSIQVSLADPEGAFLLEGGPQTFTLAANERRQLTVGFDPPKSGALEGTLKLESATPGLSALVKLTGVGVAPGPDLVVVIKNNNAGSNTVGQPARVLPGFLELKSTGQRPLVISAFRFPSNLGEFWLEPAAPGGLTLQPGEVKRFDLLFSPTQPGLRKQVLEIASNDPDMPVYSAVLVGAGLAPAGVEYGSDFVALESPDFPDGPVLRARTDAKGNFEFFLPPDQRYHGVIFDPVSGLLAHLYGNTAPSGQNTQFGVPLFQASTAPDSDGDGLPDDAEFAIGTNPNKADTDGNGVDDYTEIVQGRNPLGGRSAISGIIGRAATQGTPQNVTLVAPDPGNPAQLHAYVATGGMVILDVTQPSLPVVLGRFQPPGLANEIAVDPQLKLAAIAAIGTPDNPNTGVSLADISDPSAPVLVKVFGYSATEVEVADGFAYTAIPSAGVNTALRSIDMVARTASPELPLPIKALSSMAREAGFLYVLGDETLCVVSFVSGQMTLRGTLKIGGATGKLTVGDGVAYVPISSVTPLIVGGYATVDVTDPDHPRLIQGALTPPSVSAPSTAAAYTGSGPLLLVGNAGGDVGATVDLMNASSPTNTYQFVTRFKWPAPPMSVASGAGYAFVADLQGLSVLNYLQFDTRGEPPRLRNVQLLSDAPASADLQVIEGHEFHVRVGVSDDVQAHSVELLVNGQLTQRSVSFPFNLSGIAPDLGPQSSNLVVQVRATDTGGNVALSEPLVARIIHDPVAPVLLQIDPAENEKKGRGFQEARFIFSKPMAQSATEVANFDVSVVNGAKIPLLSGSLSEKDRVVALNFERLEPGEYQLTARSSQIKDRAGNALGTSDLVRRFSVDPYSIRWISTNEGHWFVATNWSPARVPGPEDTVLIDVPGREVPVHITASAGWQFADLRKPVSVRRLESKEPMIIVYVDLHADEHIRVDNTMYLFTAGMSNTLWLAASNTVIQGPQFNGPMRLRNVRMEGDFKMTDRLSPFPQPTSTVVLELLDSFRLDGSISASFAFSGDAPTRFPIRVPYSIVIDGVGTIYNPNLIVGAAYLVTDRVPNAEQISIGPGITMRGDLNLAVAGQDTLFVNRGRLIAEFPYTQPLRSISYVTQSDTNRFINENSIEVRNGARLNINAFHTCQFINAGVLKAADRAYLAIAASWSSSKAICEPGAAFELNGTLLTEPGQVSELSGGGLWLAGRNGVFSGGTVRLTDGAIVEGSPILRSLTFEGDIHNYEPNVRSAALPPGFTGYLPRVVVGTNLTLNGSIIFRRQPTDVIAGEFFWSGGRQRLDGRARIVYERAANPSILHSGGGDLTLGPEVTIQADSVILGSDIRFGSGPAWSLNNLGTILVDGPGHYARLNTYFTNSGTIRIGSSALLTNASYFAQTAAGKLVIAAGGNEPGVTHGQLVSLRDVVLGGTLALETVAPYLPKSGDVFQLFTYSARQGAFATYLTPPPPGGLAWSPDYTATAFSLRLAAGPGTPLAQLADANPGFLRLNGAGAHAQVAHAPVLNAFPFTLMAWVKTQRAASQVDAIASKYREGAFNGYSVFVHEGRLRAWYFRDQDRAIFPGGLGLDGGTIADGRWHHVAFVVSEEGAVLYVDGEAKAEQPWSNAAAAGPPASEAPLQFGRYDELPHSFAGDLDDVVIITAALSPAEINGWKDGQPTASDDPTLVGWWRFDETDATRIAPDASGHGHAATLLEEAEIAHEGSEARR